MFEEVQYRKRQRIPVFIYMYKICMYKTGRVKKREGKGDMQAHISLVNRERIVACQIKLLYYIEYNGFSFYIDSDRVN